MISGSSGSDGRSTASGGSSLVVLTAPVLAVITLAPSWPSSRGVYGGNGSISLIYITFLSVSLSIYVSICMCVLYRVLPP